MTEETGSHGETEQQRRAEKSGSTGRPAQQADVALLDRIGNTNASSRDALVFPIRSGNARRFATPVEPRSRPTRLPRGAAIFSVRLRCFVSPCQNR